MIQQVNFLQMLQRIEHMQLRGNILLDVHAYQHLVHRAREPMWHAHVHCTVWGEDVCNDSGVS